MYLLDSTGYKGADGDELSQGSPYTADYPIDADYEGRSYEDSPSSYYADSDTREEALANVRNNSQLDDTGGINQAVNSTAKSKASGKLEDLANTGSKDKAGGESGPGNSRKSIREKALEYLDKKTGGSGQGFGNMLKGLNDSRSSGGITGALKSKGMGKPGGSGASAGMPSINKGAGGKGLSIAGDLKKLPLAGTVIEQMQDEVGEKIGTLLWVIWGLLALIGLLGLITLVGIPGAILTAIVFNGLLISPKLVYKLTVLILELVGVGEVLNVLDSTVIDENKIKIGGVQKLSILLFDLLFIIIVAGMIVLFLYISCWLGGQTTVLGSGAAKIALSGVDWIYGTNYAALVDQVCSIFK